MRNCGRAGAFGPNPGSVFRGAAHNNRLVASWQDTVATGGGLDESLERLQDAERVAVLPSEDPLGFAHALS